jgi:hypothetical protein
VDDQPTPTEVEHERTADELPEHQAMQYRSHEDPQTPADDAPVDNEPER